VREKLVQVNHLRKTHCVVYGLLTITSIFNEMKLEINLNQRIGLEMVSTFKLDIYFFK